MPSFALAAIGRDRPGIVAAVSRVLYEQGCNVEDSSMTLLRGNFAIMLILRAPEGLTSDGLSEALVETARDLSLLYSVLPVDDTADVRHPTHILTVYGADRTGILYRVSEALTAAGVNITDLDSRLVGVEGSAVYAMILELAPPAEADLDLLGARLMRIAGDVGVEMTLREIEEDVL